MIYPDFFNKIETITLQDDLANFLGTFENGLVEFSYLDIVNGETPKRDEIFVSFKEDASEGVAGVIANVFTQITDLMKILGA